MTHGYAKVFFFSAFKDLSNIKKLEVISQLNKQKTLFNDDVINKCIAAQKGIPYPSFNEKLIPIVFASDNTYAPYLAVLMKSIIENASKDYNYEFMVLESRISKLSKDRIEGMFKGYKNLAIKFVNPSNVIKGIEFPTNSYYTEETYYRLCCQSIFSYYKKILYIDVDTIVLRDISELFNIDIEGYLLGASINAGTIPHAKNNWPLRGINWRDYLVNTLQIKDLYNYFQAGVLLINIPEITKFDLQGKALTKLKTIKPVLVDQDILNFVCEGKVKKISLQWDFLDSFRPEWKTEDRVNWLSNEDREDYIKASKDPYILHYAGEWLRAWEFPDVRYSDLWWHYARMTPFYEEILFRNIQNRYIRNTKNNTHSIFHTISKMNNSIFMRNIYTFSSYNIICIIRTSNTCYKYIINHTCNSIFTRIFMTSYTNNTLFHIKNIYSFNNELNPVFRVLIRFVTEFRISVTAINSRLFFHIAKLPSGLLILFLIASR